LDARASELQSGRVVTTLAPADFAVELDGLPVPVATATYVEFATAPAGVAGRSVLVVLDDLSFEAPISPDWLEELARWVAIIGPRDLIGVATTSGRGPAVPLSTDRITAQAALRGGVGGRAAPATGARQDQLERTAVDQANALHDLVRQLQQAPGTRVLLLVSNGFAATGGDDLVGGFSRAVRQAGASVFAITPRTASSDADRLVRDGLERLVTEARGRLLGTAGSIDAALKALLTEVPGAYRLGVDTSGVPAERPFRSLRVTANNLGIAVESPTRALVAGPVRGILVDDQVRSALAGGEPAAGVPLSSAGVVGRSESGSGIRFLNTVTVPGTASGPLAMTFVLVDEAGQEVTGGTAAMTTPVAGHFRTSFAITMPEGRFRLRVAVADREGRIGILERGVLARLRPIGPHRSGDLQVLWRAEEPPWYLTGGQPIPEVAKAVAISLEIFAASPGGQPPSIAFLLFASDGREVGRRDLTAAPAPGGWRALSEVSLDAIPAGIYDAALRLSIPGQDPVTVQTSLRKGASAAVAAARAPKPSRDEFLAIFQADVKALWPKFDLAATLAPAATRRLVDDFIADAKRPLPAVLARSLPHDPWLKGLEEVAAGKDAVAAFSRAVVALRRSNPAAAEVALAEARKGVPGSMAVTLLDGVLHAAAGRDEQAIAAWREALGPLSADPDWSLALAEALGRRGDFAGAAEALTLLPSDPSRVEAVRLIDASIALGRFDQARAAAERGSRAGGGGYRGRLAFYSLVFAFADALVPGAPEATIQTFLKAAEAFLTTGSELAPLVRAWIDMVR
jgi:hypothetical protein